MILALQWNINQGECCFDHDISTLIHPSWGHKENKDKLDIKICSTVSTRHTNITFCDTRIIC